MKAFESSTYLYNALVSGCLLLGYKFIKFQEFEVYPFGDCTLRRMQFYITKPNLDSDKFISYIKNNDIFRKHPISISTKYLRTSELPLFFVIVNQFLVINDTVSPSPF